MGHKIRLVEKRYLEKVKKVLSVHDAFI